MNETVMTKIISYCEFVQRGKPTAMIPLQSRYVNEAKNIIDKFQLSLYVEDLSKGWKTIWVYKEKYMLEVIKKLPNEPKSAFEHWVLGKAFGYSDEAIKEFIEKISV